MNISTKNYFYFSIFLLLIFWVERGIAQASFPVDNPPNNNPLVAQSDWSLHGQATYVIQWHPAFRAPYTGQNSLDPTSISAQTSDFTLYLGRKLWQGAELYLNPEIDQGFGFSNTLGLGGFF